MYPSPQIRGTAGSLRARAGFGSAEEITADQKSGARGHQRQQCGNDETDKSLPPASGLGRLARLVPINEIPAQMLGHA